MKKAILLSLVGAWITCMPVRAAIHILDEEAQGGFLGEGTTIVHTDFVFDPDAGDDGSYGAEIAFGQALFTRHDAGVMFQYQEADEAEIGIVGAYIEEHYQLDWPLIPFLAAGAGYAFTDADEGVEIDEDGFAVRLGGGVKLPLTESLAISAQALFYWGSDDLWLDDGGQAESDSIEGSLGLRWYF